jgi:hypothetical protein
MWVKRAIAASVGSGLIGLAAVTVGTAPAAATDRPTNVAFVRAWHNDILHHNGTITVGAGVRCVAGWAPAELDMLVGQGPEGQSASASGTTIPTVRCDNRWHKVLFTLTDVGGKFHTGVVGINAQFLVTNNESGDSAGAHNQVSGRLHLKG